MAQITVLDDKVELDAPTLVEGLPGIGLVGKIAADHLVETFDMRYYAKVVCEGLPRIAVYTEGDSALRPPVRLYADEDRDLVVLQSDVPISHEAASDFAGCVVGWIDGHDATPIFQSGLPAERSEAPPELYGVSTGRGAELLASAAIASPDESGVVAGPTGTLLYEAELADLTAVGLVVESDPQFPDPEAAHVLIERGIAPLAGIEVDTTELVEHAGEIRKQKEQLAKRMQQAGEESSRAEPLRMYQ